MIELPKLIDPQTTAMARMKMNHLPLLYLCLCMLKIIVAETMKSSSSTCNLTQCGNVTLSYPFGMGPSCAISSDFQIECNSTALPNYPYLTLHNRTFKIYDISDTQVRIANSLAWSCSDWLGYQFRNFTTSIDLEGTPYSFSEVNKFTLVGCDDYALIHGSDLIKNYTSGCLSLCSDVDDALDGECSGIGCCQSPVTKGLKFYNISLGSFSTRRNFPSSNPCSYLFLGEQEKITFHGASDLRNYMEFWDRIRKNVPIVLDWAIGNLNCSQAESLRNYSCHLNSLCIDSGRGYRCVCDNGYHGNPYLKPGCIDIDECSDANKHVCVDKCENNPGGYSCSCPPRYHGDGYKNGTGCTPPDHTNFPTSKLILGIGFGILFPSIGIALLYLTVKKRRFIQLKKMFFQQNGGHLLNQHLAENVKGMKSPRIFTAEELKEATSRYAEDRVLGSGGFGTVYKGILPDKRVVAIKKAKIVNQNQIQQFINEVIILTQVNHRNVVELLGCCLETEVPLLVYEFISNGTLSDHIQVCDGTEKKVLSWEERLRIAIEAAGALAYLHSAAAMPVIHGDVKSVNILLDETYTAKIADFGASRLVPLDKTLVITLVQGTFGYLDPECFQSHQVTEKSDVYSFGVVLAELLTGRRAVFTDEACKQETNLSTYFVNFMDKHRLYEILDPRIVREEEIHVFEEVGSLIKKCLNICGKERPNMNDVVFELKNIRNSNKLLTWPNQQDQEEVGCIISLGSISPPTCSDTSHLLSNVEGSG